ncbi:amidohydrolase [Salipiger aestuarii]|uniref:Putative amidohydrolase n=1 Tax=Salipiger aestuarii TaxID=568098 RepID=A0A327XZI7_9RHOB|nr:carbon-nitrogen hydrolase family protein [Salipiger aestuarii]KAA8606252.1 amidohydrolase [Salipiger aestuarii]KAA8609388.1 amidohydrolase [Salipiger aestuarii]KAB2540906.1 amidohydrolase [Salipiger aestuarii]RAK12805.1 putative amidohydrolase [Salipiger aestuarii]
MKLATAAYKMDFLDSWDGYVAKLTDWVGEAAGNGADLMVFPEYGAMELATLSGRAAAMDLETSLHAVADRIPAVDALHAELARKHGVHILAASAPVFDARIGDRPVNRARLFVPSGAMGHQDKQIMTRFEREDWGVIGGGPLALFDTSLGKIGILICYDSEYPLLARALMDADMLLVPSCTEAAHGYNRVRIGSMARALEQQCVTVMSSTVGDCDWSWSVETNHGAGGIFGPPDTGFPADGVLAQGAMDKPGWTYATLDLDAVARVRKDGVVLNRSHWDEQAGRDGPAELRDLS